MYRFGVIDIGKVDYPIFEFVTLLTIQKRFILDQSSQDWSIN